MSDTTRAPDAPSRADLAEIIEKLLQACYDSGCDEWLIDESLAAEARDACTKLECLFEWEHLRDLRLEELRNKPATVPPQPEPQASRKQDLLF